MTSGPSTVTRTSEGFPTGLRRAVESHTAHGLPLSLHLSGVLTNAIGWASSPDPRQDGLAFLARVSELFDGDPLNDIGDTLKIIGVVRNGRFFSVSGLIDRSANAKQAKTVE